MAKSVKLSRSYTVGSETFTEVRLREPKFGDLLLLGEPFDVYRGYAEEKTEVVAAYLDRLVTEPQAGAVRELSLEDGLLVKDAVLGFFSDARRSAHERRNSSSASAGDLATSTI